MSLAARALVYTRAFLGASIAGAVGVGIGTPLLVAGAGTESTGNLLRSERPLPTAFTRRLTVPRVLSPVRSDADGDHYRIVQTAASASIVPGATTRIWGYNGTFPGPTIESRRGRPAIVTHVNRLPVPTVVHLHGGRTPASSDGHPIDFVYPPGMSHHGGHGGDSMVGDTTHGSREYTFPLGQRAATLWYHDHRMDFTGPSVWRGLAGFHIHRDEEEDGLGLPSGARELPLMITDRSFAADGSFRYPSIDPGLLHTPGVSGDYVAGVLGDTMLVNGVPWPVAEVDAVQYRLRILNACIARRLSLRLDPAPASASGFAQIGTEGGAARRPGPSRSPGARSGAADGRDRRLLRVPPRHRGDRRERLRRRPDGEGDAVRRRKARTGRLHPACQAVNRRTAHRGAGRHHPVVLLPGG
ncbi:multicopper oxidase family protein [Streptomyces sp. NPDC059922]|uniref:multicopper oxidase family protein n=1 Tax=Streptomyces sp. NPDC059922 TaxID=3347005 RepID=UPI003652F5FD